MTVIDRIKSSGTPINVTIPIQSQDEIGQLSESFNDMAAELVKDKAQRELAENELKKYKDNLEALVKERTKQLETVQQELIEQAHRAGMARIATDTLHNVSNVLNSVKIAAQMVNEIAKRSVISEYEKANRVLRSNLDSLEDFVKTDPKVVSLLKFYLELESPFKAEKENIISHIKRLNEKIDTIAEIVIAQQKHAAVGGATDFHSLESVISDTLEIISVSKREFKIQITMDIPQLPKVRIHKTKFVHILINLLNNAKDSMLENPEEYRKLTISASKEDCHILLKISDTGTGIEKSDLKKIFSHGFSTKKDGHGFGLHSSANYMTEMGGDIWAESEGAGKGATFCLTIPTENKKT
jgi:signal transduction histidine kinase